MKPEELVGRTLAVVFAMDEGELEWKIVSGLVARESEKLVIVRDAQSPFALCAAWLPRIKPVAESDESIRQILGTDFWLILTIGSLPNHQKSTPE